MRSLRSLLIVLMLSAGSATAAEPWQAARAYRQEHEAKLLTRFAELLAIPNRTLDVPNLKKNADYLVEQFSHRGVKMRLLELSGAAPLVYGEILVPNAKRTLGIYVHYDGQPTVPERWVTGDPWKPALYSARHDEGGRLIPFPKAGEAVNPEWRIYGRSAGDDKAPLLVLLALLDAFREAGVQPTSNVKFLFDGEEESGSPHLREYLSQHRDRVEDVDLWLFCDGPVHQSRRPQVVFGVRGVTGIEVTVYGANRPLHSGHYGNWAPVPGTLLVRLLATMKDDDGRVLIEGFYDTVEPLGEVERAALKTLPVYDEELRRELGLAVTEADGGLLAERLTLPSLTVRGLASADVGTGARNIIPPTATAALGIRLVKGNDPAHMRGLVEEHIRQQGYCIVREDPDAETRRRCAKIAKVTAGRGTPAARTPMDNPRAQEILSAVDRVLDKPALRVPTLGGTLPLYLFTEDLGKPGLILPIANHDNNQHAANENLRIANLWYGIDVFASVLTIP